MINHKHSGTKVKHVRLKTDAVNLFYEQKTYSRGIFYHYRWDFSNIFRIKTGAGKLCFWATGHIHALCNRKQWTGPAQFGQFLQLGLESNRPLKIVTDRAFAVLMKAGRPGTTIPSPMTVSRDINSAFERCRERVDQILKVSSRSRVFFIWLIFINRNIQVMFTLELMPGLLRTTEPSSPGLSIFTMRDMRYVSSSTLLRFPRFVCYPLLLIRCLIYLWHAVSYWEDTCKRVSPHAHRAWARQQGE